MIPFTFPTFTNPLNEAGECKVSYLSSVSGLTAWTDYIPVQTVADTGNIEGMTEATGYQAVHPVGASGNVAWTDYIPVYEDATKTVPWSTDANGYIPVGLSEDGVQAFLDEADIGLGDITHSAIATAGSLTPNFTRATEKRIPDHEGILRTCIAGELGFPGARRVRNLLSFTEDFDNAAWTKINGGAGSAPTVTSGFTAPDGTATAWRLQANRGGNAAGDYSVVRQNHSSANCRAIYVKSNTGATQEIYFGAANGPSDKVTATTEWTRVSNPLVFNALTDIGSYGAVGNSTQSVDVLIWHPQAEDITGRTDQTTPSEYVSVGVESAPAYHGSMVDGVKCFPTDLDGNALTTMTTPLIELAATNVMTWSNTPTSWSGLTGTAPVQNVTGPNGQANYAWTGTDDSAVLYEREQNARTLTAATYTSQLKVKKTIGTQPSYPVYYEISGVSLRIALCTIDTTNGVATVWTSFTGLTVTTSSARCTSFNNDFWLVELTFLADATSWQGSWVYAGTANPTQATGDLDATVQGSSVACDFGCELGTAATSYIPTTTAAATRNADQLYYTGADIANIKTLAAVDFKRESGFTNSTQVVVVDDSTANEYVGITLGSATAVTFNVVDGGVTQVSTSASNAYTPGTLSSAAVSFATNDVKMAKDGVAQTADTVATMPTVSRIEYGMQIGAFQMNGYPGKVYAWLSNKSQSELNAVTA